MLTDVNWRTASRQVVFKLLELLASEQGACGIVVMAGGGGASPVGAVCAGVKQQHAASVCQVGHVCANTPAVAVQC
jgi:hypothetical protein